MSYYPLIGTPVPHRGYTYFTTTKDVRSALRHHVLFHALDFTDHDGGSMSMSWVVGFSLDCFFYGNDECWDVDWTDLSAETAVRLLRESNEPLVTSIPKQDRCQMFLCWWNCFIDDAADALDIRSSLLVHNILIRDLKHYGYFTDHDPKSVYQLSLVEPKKA